MSKVAWATPLPISALLRASTVILTLTSLGGTVANAQSSILPNGMSVSILAGTPGAPRFSQDVRFGAAKSMLAQPHLNPSGKPCVSVNPSSKAQILNENIYDHSLLVSNECSRTIRLLVCYYHAQNCSTISIAGYTRQQKLFGVFPERDFRIEYREYLD